MEIQTMAVSEKEIRRVLSMFYDRSWKNRHAMREVIPFILKWLLESGHTYDEILLQGSPENRFRLIAFAVTKAVNDYCVDDSPPFIPDNVDYWVSE